MRSRIWRDSTSLAGSCPPWRCSWRTTRLTRSPRSFDVITSSFTTATMRSTGMMREGVAARFVSRRPCASAPSAAAASAAMRKRMGSFAEIMG